MTTLGRMSPGSSSPGDRARPCFPRMWKPLPLLDVLMRQRGNRFRCWEGGAAELAPVIPIPRGGVLPAARPGLATPVRGGRDPVGAAGVGAVGLDVLGSGCRGHRGSFSVRSREWACPPWSG